MDDNTPDNLFAPWDTEFNAFVGDGDAGHPNYAEGFLKAAFYLLEAIAEKKLMGERNTLVFPILNNARHGVELYLKLYYAQIKGMGITSHKVKGGHNISDYFNAILETKPADAELAELLSNISDIVKFIAETDPSGQEFRYAVKTDKVASMDQWHVVSLRRIYHVVSTLCEKMPLIRYRLLDLHDEIKTGSFTSALSRKELAEISKKLPDHSTWQVGTLKDIRDDIKASYKLSKKEFETAIELIKKHREFSADIGIEHKIPQLIDAEILFFANEYAKVHIIQRPQAARVLSVQDMVKHKILAKQHHYSIKAFNLIKEKVSIKTMMVIQTLYYSAQLGEYSKHFEDTLKHVEDEYHHENDPHWKFHHIYSKANVFEFLIKGLEGLGQISLLEKISRIIDDAAKSAKSSALDEQPPLQPE